MIETALLIALVAMVALPAVRMMGVKVMKPSCEIAEGFGVVGADFRQDSQTDKWVCAYYDYDSDLIKDWFTGAIVH